MDLVDTAWTQAGADKYDDLTKEQTYKFLSKFITSQFEGKKQEQMNLKYFNLMATGNMVSSDSVAHFIRTTLEIEPVKPEPIALKNNKADGIKGVGKRKSRTKNQHKIRKSNLNNHDTNSNINDADESEINEQNSDESQPEINAKVRYT